MNNIPISNKIPELDLAIKAAQEAGNKILNQKVYSNILEIKEHIDMVDVFRKSSDVDFLIDDILKCSPTTIWLQIGVINDKIKNIATVRKVILCSGKIYYDLIKERENQGKNDIAIIRIEQLYPFPYDDLEVCLKAYTQINEVVWCQEEPANQGAWFSHRHRIQRVLDRSDNSLEIGLVSRDASAAPAVGMMKLHLKQQEDLVALALK